VRTRLGHVYALAVVLFGWVLFRSETLADTGLMLRSLAGVADVSREARALWLDFSPKQILAIVAGVCLSVPVVPWLRKAMRRRMAASPGGGLRLAVHAGECALLTALGLLSLLFVAGGSYNPFLYFRF
jgi:alginate O-acetyltransferase complex protein AlgI